ncbi:hypothetical protein TNCV_929951 [Trichonephila clavipes]|uniref:Uncharacterized protein n=1 Tax=Trichonephila clavipes TaxID=2585209 RepID=A0A8X7BDP5_TRICX|nr:hypothetical protein TNCV_929951 [Trichonephila clavipes]
MDDNLRPHQVVIVEEYLEGLGELEQSLLRVWSSLPITVTDNLIDSVEIRCHQCIEARGYVFRLGTLGMGLGRIRFVGAKNWRMDIDYNDAINDCVMIKA